MGKEGKGYCQAGVCGEGRTGRGYLWESAAKVRSVRARINRLRGGVESSFARVTLKRYLVVVLGLIPLVFYFKGFRFGLQCFLFLNLCRFVFPDKHIDCDVAPKFYPT